MTEFKITPHVNITPYGKSKNFTLKMVGVEKAHVDPNGITEVTISYEDIVRMKLACEDARVRYA